MISKETLNLKWLQKISKQNKNTDKILIEKTIKTMFLLEGLSESKLTYIFRGGTAVMLLLKSSKRFSIDIDIIMQKKNNLNLIFNKICNLKGFSRFELQERKTNYNIEKEHYKFFYSPIYRTSDIEEYILLDIVFEKPNYQNIISIQIDSLFVQQDSEPQIIQVPSINDILGDKLTAFAPNTTGIPYKKGGYSRGIEIIKQLYDIGNLFDHADNLVIIEKTFKNIAFTEMKYRNLNITIDNVLNDIYQTALCISTRGMHGRANYKILQQGINRIKPYIFSETYHLEKAIAHSSKVAYLSCLINDSHSEINHFKNPSESKDWYVEQPFYTKINKLKKSNPEAFFYWFKTYLLSKNAPDNT